MARATIILVALLLVACEKQPATAETPAASSNTDEAKTENPALDDRRAIDVHTHLNPYGVALAVEAFDRNSIHRAVNMSGGYGKYTRDGQAAAAQFPGRIANFFNIDWRGIDEADFGTRRAAELEAAIAEGFAGLKISKHLGLGVKTEDGELLAVDDERLAPIWNKAGELGVVVAIHTGDPKAFFEPPGPQNERHAELSHAPSWSFHGEEFPSREELLASRDRMVARHPDTTFMLLHVANNPEDIDYVDNLMSQNSNVIIDLSARIGEIGRHDADRVQNFFEKHRDRILFGTDLQLSARPQGNQLAYSLTLGSISKEPPRLGDIDDFYQAHWDYLEKTGAPIAHPIPIQGEWKVNPVDLPPPVLQKVYYTNAERIVFAPWLARNAASQVATRAGSLAQ